MKWAVEIYNRKTKKIEEKQFDYYTEAKLYFTYANGRRLYHL